MPRRFPPPSTTEETHARFLVKDRDSGKSPSPSLSCTSSRANAKNGASASAETSTWRGCEARFGAAMETTAMARVFRSFPMRVP